MQVTGKVVVVTGGGNGIGKAMCEAFHRAGAARVVVADIDPDGARAVATPIGGAAFKCDVGKEKDILHVIEETEHQFGPIALFCSNAGIGGGFDPLSVNAGGTSDEPWSAKLGRSCHGACLCGAASDPAHEGARRRLFPQHDFGGGACCRRSAARPIRPPSMPRLALPRISRSRTRPTTSRFRSCARRASTPTCCARSRRARNPATATFRRSRWRRTC